MNIITLTLNPCLDLYCEAGGDEAARDTRVMLGGKGINVSRALLENGIDSTAVVAIPSLDKEELISLLEESGIRYIAVESGGEVRKNVTLIGSDGEQTRICSDGDCAAEDLLERVFRTVDGLCDDGSILVIAGSVPSGVDVDALCECLLVLCRRGVRLVLDSRSLSREQVLRLSPWLIKPNREEIAAYTDITVTDAESAAFAARELYLAGVQNVLVTLDGDGAVLCSCDGEFFVSAPDVAVRSAVGAGDATVAGFIAAACLGERGADALRRAVCYGSAACMREGTSPPSPSDVHMLLGGLE